MRYEHDGKFWTITRAGSVLTLSAGKVGNKGRTTTKHHANEREAQAAHDALVLAKQREGFRIAAAEVAPPRAPAPAPIIDERGPALADAIARDPEDAAAFTVYGDWLLKHGDPRGELIALQQAEAKTAGKYFAEHAAQFLGPLAPLVPDVRVLDAAPLYWKHGFIRRAELTTAASVAQLLAHPSGQFLVELAVRVADDAPAVIAHVNQHAPATLRDFDLFARAKLGRLEITAPLERLGITARRFELGALAIPTLRRAKFLAASMASSAVEAIAAAPWPVLERLELRFCGALGAAEADFHDLRPLLLRTDMPALTHLKLRGCAFAGAIVRTLSTAPLSRQLEVLDFSGGDFTPQDLQLLAHHAGNFPALRELWLPYNYVTPQVEQQLAPVAQRVIRDSKGAVDRLDAELG